MKHNWTYRDIFDLEYFFRLDSEQHHSTLHQRDRAIYLEAFGTKKAPDPREALYLWLQARRAQEFPDHEPDTPGTTIQQSIALLYLLLPAAGLVFGLLSGLAFFTYSGTLPVNVFHFLALFVLSQIVMLLVLFLSLATRLAGLGRTVPPIIVKLYGALLSRFNSWTRRRVITRLPAAGRNSYEHTLGLLTKTGRTYGSLLYWPLFSLSQLVLLFFNTGLLGATLYRVITSDIAFGWQSTIQFSAEAISRGVKIMALPWSWLVPQQIAYPSLQEIIGSRIILKEGIYHLATLDLISWWPFLVFCLLVYGLGLRLLLWLSGRYLQFRSLKRLKLNTPDCLNVQRRMLTPLLSTQAAPEPGQPHEPPGMPSVPDSQGTPAVSSSGFPLLVLLPDDITRQCSWEKIGALVEAHGFSLAHSEVVMRDYETDRLFLQKLAANTWPDKSGVLLIIEAWMPPIGDTLSLLKDLRTAIGSAVPLFVGLVGAACGNGGFSEPTRDDRALWKQKLEGLGDPFLSVLILTEANSLK